ncbi:MAG: flagellar hook-basal body complex protein [Rhodospirillaceae bacterium]
MSLYGALFSGVSGLQSQSSAMGAISDNVSNINTVGYKSTQVNFQTLVTQQTSITQYSPGGVQSVPRTGVDIQGLLQATSSSTDVGISGSGFMVVSEQAENPSGFAYSRAGSFIIDQDGYMQNVAGFYLQGWPLENWDGTATASTLTVDGNTFQRSYRNDNGDTYYLNPNAVDATNMQPLNLTTIGGTARATSTVAIGANLPAAADVAETEKTNALIFDSLGNSHNLQYTWTKRAQNSWDVELDPPAGSTYVAIDDQTSNRRTSFSAGRLDFENIPASGQSFTMAIGGNTYTFNFSDTTEQLYTDSSVANSSTIAATFAAGDQIVIGGVTFSLTTTATATTDVDITGLTTVTEVRDAVINAAESHLDTVYGPGNWVTSTTTTGEIASSLPITAGGTNAGPTFGTPAVENFGTDLNFTLNTSNKSLSQVLDELGLMVNTALGREFGTLPSTVPAQWGGRVAGENAITFRQADITNTLDVNASSVVDSSGLAAVQQTSAYSVPALNSTVRWTNTAASGNYAVTFNGDGTPDTFFGSDEIAANDPRSRVRIGWSNGALNMDGSSAPPGDAAVSLFLGNYNTSDGFTQLAGDYQLNYLSQNGNKFGNFSGISISEAGVVTALFDNGVTTPIFQVPLATFVNPNGMSSLTGNVFQQTDDSGLPTVRQADSAGAGSIQQATLEQSTVDLGEEFTNMITTQQAYSAAAKIITTTDEMLDELIRIKR